jgi:hypothetical protein
MRRLYNEWQQYKSAVQNSCEISRVQAVEYEQFSTSSQWVFEELIGVSWEDCFCEEKIYVEYLESKIVIVVRQDPLLWDD